MVINMLLMEVLLRIKCTIVVYCYSGDLELICGFEALISGFRGLKLVMAESGLRDRCIVFSGYRGLRGYFGGSR